MAPDEKPNQSVRKVKANHGLGFKPLVLFHSQYLFQISLNLQDDSTKAAIINQKEKKHSIEDPCFLRIYARLNINSHPETQKKKHVF